MDMSWCFFFSYPPCKQKDLLCGKLGVSPDCSSHVKVRKSTVRKSSSCLAVKLRLQRGDSRRNEGPEGHGAGPQGRRHWVQATPWAHGAARIPEPTAFISAGDGEQVDASARLCGRARN